MTLEEKINRYRSIPKRIAELEIDKDICTSVKAVKVASPINGLHKFHVTIGLKNYANNYQK